MEWTRNILHPGFFKLLTLIGLRFHNPIAYFCLYPKNYLSYSFKLIFERIRKHFKKLVRLHFCLKWNLVSFFLLLFVKKLNFYEANLILVGYETGIKIESLPDLELSPLISTVCSIIFIYFVESLYLW